MNVQQEVNDIITTCQSIEELRHIKVRHIRANTELYDALYSTPCYGVNVEKRLGHFKHISINIFDGTKVKVEHHKMVTPWMLIVTPVNNKSDRIYR